MVIKTYDFVLSIGLANAEQKDVVEVEFTGDETEEQVDEILEKTWREWAHEYIDGGWGELKTC